EAKAFVQRYGIKTQQEFREWVSGRLRRRGLPVRPKNMPTNPHRRYSASGWKGDNDFLCTKPKTRGRGFRPMESAKEYVRSQQLGSVKEYIKWTRGEFKDRPLFPADIPASPYDVYGKDKNWKGMSDFLGSKPSARYVEFWPFPKARKYVRSLK